MNDFMECAAYNWPNWSHLQRMEFLRSLRLHLIAERKREERKQALKKYFLEQWLKEGKC